MKTDTNLTPSQLLAAHERFMSGQPISLSEKTAADSVALAACFAATALNRAMTVESGIAALTRAFLLALVDPLHPDLDYLRADPASGAVERANRIAASGDAQ